MSEMQLPDLPSGFPVAVDTETSGLHPDDGARVACVSLTWGPDKDDTLALPFDQGIRDKLPTEQLDLFGNEADPNLGESEWYEMLEWLDDHGLVFHNAKFDLTLLQAGTRHWPGIDLVDSALWDTMLGSHVFEPREPMALGASAERNGVGKKTGLDGVKEWLKKAKLPMRYDYVPWHVIKPYVTSDTELTWALYEIQDRWAEADDEKFARFEREMDLMRALTRMEARGVRYDAAKSLDAAEELERRAQAIEKGMPFAANPTAAKAWFFDHLGLQADRVSEKTGKPSLDEEQVRKWVGEGVEGAAEYAAVSKARRAVSMWYQGYPDKIGQDGRLRTNYRQGKVKSGRMSVERVQLQAMPKADKGFEGIPGVRDLLMADEGKGLWNLDLSQAELRVAAQYAQCQLMLQELASDDPDIHGKTCRNVLHVEPDSPDWKLKRDIAKRLTFGGIFQIGGRKFQATLSKLADIHLPKSECHQMVASWRRMYPEYGTVYRRAENKASRDGWVKLLPGTEYEVKSWFGPRDWPHTAWNRTVQGSLAEFFKLWMAEVERQWPGYMILTVHDSVVLEAPLDEGDQLAREVAARGAEMATDLFKIEMKVDTDRW